MIKKAKLFGDDSVGENYIKLQYRWFKNRHESVECELCYGRSLISRKSENVGRVQAAIYKKS